jgi:uncharacterized protein
MDKKVENAMHVIVNEGGRSACVVISAGAPAEAVTAAALAELARQSGVAVDEAIERRLAEIAAAYSDAGLQSEPVTTIFAEHVEPVHGRDGWIEWCDGFNPEPQPEHAETQPNGAEPIDHYTGEQFISVRSGDCIATIHPPEPGLPGRDVHGGAIAAKPGKPCTMKPGAGITVSHMGEGGPATVTAAADGVLRLNRDSLDVTRLMDVPGNVDFSTGHIEFDGTVSVRDSVRDRFRIRATGDVVVGGLVEAATIMCRGNLICRRGVAGRGEARVVIGGNLEAAFLNDLRGNIAGSLTVRREIIGCELIVGGEVRTPKGRMIGGMLVASGKLAIGAIGSEAQPPTTLRLGEAPLLIRRFESAEKRLAELAEELEQIRAQLESFMRRPRLNPDQSRLLDELKQRGTAVRSEIDSARTQRDEIARTLTAARVVNARVERIIHPKVCIKACGEEFHFQKPMKGPLHIMLNRDGRVRMRIGEGELRPLTEFTGIQLRRAA